MSDPGTGLLNEHEAAAQSPVESYQEPPEETQTRKLAEKLYRDAKIHRKKYDANWLSNYKFFRGKQWEEKRPSYRHAEVINMVFKSIQSVIPIMTDSKPKMSFLPQEPSDLELSEILNEVCDADWEKHGWLYQFTEALYEAHFYGTGLMYCGYDPEGDRGAGAIDICSADPFYFFPDPNAKDVNHKSCRYVVIAEPIDLDLLKAEFPDKARYLRADLEDLSYDDKASLEEIKYRAPNRDKIYVETEDRPDGSRRPLTLKLTVYVKSAEVVEEAKKKLGIDGAETLEYEQRLKYPNGRKIVVGGGCLLSDGPFDYEDGLIPYARLTNYILPREFWGISEIEQLKSPQVLFNKIVSFAMDVLTTMGNPIWVVDNDSGIDTDNLFNRPGLVVEKNKGSEARREEGVQLQPFVFQLIDRLKTAFDDIAGDTDVSRGISSEGVTAASAISQLQEASRTRIRQKSRNLDQTLQDNGQQYKNRVFQYYTAPKMFRITRNGAVQKYFKFHAENRQLPDGSSERVATVRPYIQDPTTGQHHESLEAKELIQRGDFDVKVTTGSSLPFAKKERADLALQFFDRGIVDAEEVLEATDYPNKDKVLMRMQQVAADQAAMQAQAGVPPEGGAPATAAAPPPSAA